MLKISISIMKLCFYFASPMEIEIFHDSNRCFWSNGRFTLIKIIQLFSKQNQSKMVCKNRININEFNENKLKTPSNNMSCIHIYECLISIYTTWKSIIFDFLCCLKTEQISDRWCYFFRVWNFVEVCMCKNVHVFRNQFDFVVASFFAPVALLLDAS